MSPALRWPTRQPCETCGRATRVDPQLDIPDGFDVVPTNCADCGTWIWPGSWLWRMSAHRLGLALTGAPDWVSALIRAEMVQQWDPDERVLDVANHRAAAASWNRRVGPACRRVALLLRDL